ncbi:MAG TPA: type II toxin-antitoxin system HicB family antitoxin, partial [Ktedonobacteraceae bacterium]|nr:type II toxin-antitoxin system HicB family antitoxin [Ktedonobacteraceae bacterium]
IVYNLALRGVEVLFKERNDMKKYTIILEPDLEEGGFTVTLPALPGCITQGETVGQCIERAREAIAGYIEDLIANGEPVPEEIERPQMVTIDVAA